MHRSLASAPAATALSAGLEVDWGPNNPKAISTPTLSVNGLTAKTIVKRGRAGLAASHLTSGAIAKVIYDGAN